MSNYWQRRKALNMYQCMRSAEETADEIGKIYHKASLVLSNEMDKIFERFVTKHKLSEDDARKLLLSIKDKTSLEDIKAELRKGATGSDKRRLLAELEAPAYASRLNRLQEKQQQIDTLVNTVYNHEKSVSTNHYKELMNESYNRSMYEIQRQSGIGFSFNNLDRDTVDSVLNSSWSGANYSDRIWNNTQKLADSLKTELMVGLLTGERESEISKNILYQFASSANNARRLIRTESCHIANEMDMKAYEESGINTYIFVATLDLKTSDVCASLDGKRFKVKDQQAGINAPPMHPWCRSTTICDISDKELKQMKRRSRNSVTGKNETVPANMTYNEWYKKYIEDRKVGLGEVSISEFDNMGKAIGFVADKMKIKAYKIDGYKNIYSQTYSKNAQRTIDFISKSKKDIIQLNNISDIVVCKDIKGVAAYDNKNNRLYVNELLTNEDYLKKILGNDYFVAETPLDVLRHEMHHKEHWDFIKSKVVTNNNNYATINSTKNTIEMELRKYISNQQTQEIKYLTNVVSINADIGFTNNDSLNEVIAEVLLQQDKGIVKDVELLKLVRRCVK